MEQDLAYEINLLRHIYSNDPTFKEKTIFKKFGEIALKQNIVCLYFFSIMDINNLEYPFQLLYKF